MTTCRVMTVMVVNMIGRLVEDGKYLAIAEYVADSEYVIDTRPSLLAITTKRRSSVIVRGQSNYF